jgi:hypothetical protein
MEQEALLIHEMKLSALQEGLQLDWKGGRGDTWCREGSDYELRIGKNNTVETP